VIRTLLLLILAGLPCAAQSGIEAIFAPLADAKAPGAAVLVLKGGHPFYERAFGVRDLKSLSKITDGTDFRLASMSKQFTAMAIMLLVHDRKLQYEDRLTDIFPDFPEYGRAITIRHLLTHTSGLPDYEELMDKSWTPDHQIHDQDVFELLKRQKTGKFAPRASWAYSNSGYVVLGLIVAKAGAEPFPDFLHRRIFEPLHMKHTLAFVNGQNTVPSRAYGYVRKDGAFVPADQSSTSATLGDGGIYSNVNDLAKWDEALRKNTLLSKSEMAAALAPTLLANGALPNWPAERNEDNLAPGKPVSYGFGWFLDPYNGRPRMWHTGTTSGFRTVIQRFTDEDLSIIILANRTDLDVARLSLQIADLLDAREVVPRK
jgi:CubicO group peptidase (beta-lactamase class C family)